MNGFHDFSVITTYSSYYCYHYHEWYYHDYYNDSFHYIMIISAVVEIDIWGSTHGFTPNGNAPQPSVV